MKECDILGVKTSSSSSSSSSLLSWKNL